MCKFDAYSVEEDHDETAYGRSAAATILPSSFKILYVDAAFLCQRTRKNLVHSTTESIVSVCITL